MLLREQRRDARRAQPEQRREKPKPPGVEAEQPVPQHLEILAKGRVISHTGTNGFGYVPITLKTKTCAR